MMPVGLRLKKSEYAWLTFHPAPRYLLVSSKNSPQAHYILPASSTLQHSHCSHHNPVWEHASYRTVCCSVLTHPHPLRQKEPKPFLRRVRANKKGRWVGRVAEKMVLPRGVRHCTAQWSRCQLGCSCSQNFPCKFGSCYRSILSEIRVWKSQKTIFLLVA